MTDLPKIGLDIDEMNVAQLQEVCKMLVRLMNHDHDRLTVLQDRVTELEKYVQQTQGYL